MKPAYHGWGALGKAGPLERRRKSSTCHVSCWKDAITTEPKSRTVGVVEIEMSIDGRQEHTDASGPMVSPTWSAVGPGRGTACAVAACGGRAEVGTMSQGTFDEFHAPLAAGSEDGMALERREPVALCSSTTARSDVGVTGTGVSPGASYWRVVERECFPARGLAGRCVVPEAHKRAPGGRRVARRGDN